LNLEEDPEDPYPPQNLLSAPGLYCSGGDVGVSVYLLELIKNYRDC